MHKFPGTLNVVGGSQYPNSGPNNAAEYMASGLPFVTTSVQTSDPYKISFPYVTSELYFNVFGSGNEIRVGFSANGVQGSNFFVIKSDQPIQPLRIRCKELYIMAHSGNNDGFSLMAALTTIKAQNFPVLTGSVADPVTGLPMFISSSLTNEFGYDGIG